MSRRDKVVGFFLELFLAALGSGIAYAIGRAVGAGVGWPSSIAGLIFSLFLIFAFPYAGAAIISLVGLIKGRWGIALGPIAFFLGLWIFNEGAMLASETHANALDQRTFLPLEAQHDVVASDGEGYCRGSCKQILAQTQYAFATKRFAMNEPWEIYRRVEGDVCSEPYLLQSYLDFIEAGYVGICAKREKWTPAKDGLFISANDNHHSAAQKIVGPYYKGHVFEAYERRDGEDRLLGRWLAGTVRSPTSGKYEKVGEPFAPEEFYGALLGIPTRKGEIVGPATTDQLLDALIPLIDDSDSGNKALRLAVKVAQRNRNIDATAVTNRIERLLADEDNRQVYIGLRLISALQGVENLDFAKPKVLQALSSGNEQLVTASLQSIYGFPAGDRAFAQSAITALVLDPVIRQPKGEPAYSLFEQLRNLHASFEPELQAEARQRIQSQDQIAKGEMAVLLLVIGARSDGSHVELFDLIQSLQGVNFETAVDIIGDSGWEVLVGGKLNRWTEDELETLITRAADIPNERLKSYVDSFRFRAGANVKAKLVQEVERRLDVLRADPKINAEQIKKFERLREIIPRNITS